MICKRWRFFHIKHKHRFHNLHVLTVVKFNLQLTDIKDALDVIIDGAVDVQCSLEFKDEEQSQVLG